MHWQVGIKTPTLTQERSPSPVPASPLQAPCCPFRTPAPRLPHLPLLQVEVQALAGAQLVELVPAGNSGPGGQHQYGTVICVLASVQSAGTPASPSYAAARLE